MPSVSGSITVADLVDGQTGASIVFSNEAHTFVADSQGVVDVSAGGSRQLPGFSSTVSIYGGSTAFTYQNAATPTANNRWVVSGSADVAGQSYRTLNLTNDLQLRIADSDGTLTLHDRNTVTSGFVDEAGADAVALTIPIQVQINGTDITYNRSISITKALGGSAPFIRMSATRQTMAYAYGASAPKSTEGSITLTATSVNFTGTPTGTWQYSVDGGSYTNVTDGTNSDISNANTDSSTLVINRTGYDAHLGNGSVVTYRFTRTSTGAASASSDQISIVKLEDADAGASVQIAVVAGSAILKNNPTYSSTDPSTYVDLEARLYVGGNRVNQTGFSSGISRGTLTYVWSKNGTAIPASGTGSLQVTQPNNYGRTGYRIRVSGSDITDGGAEEYSCAVTYT